MATLPTRLVICVDGTNSDNSAGAGGTNVRRIYASIQRGISTDVSTGVTFDQDAIYLTGTGSPDDLISKDRIQASVLGSRYLKQIQDVYESCSKLAQELDEVWLFGFSRGAFVVRAVAGLLHDFGALASAGHSEFPRDFKKVLKHMEARRGKSEGASDLTASTRPAPKVRFVGVFETINAFNDDMFDISCNRSIRHMRQAVAMHEDRKWLVPEAIQPDDFDGSALKDYGRSLVQAHFIGQHNDMGGCAKKCGLALYPYQWMILEARQCGLVVDFGDQADGVASPQSVGFPRLKSETEMEADDKLWTFTTENGIVTNMHDLRGIHGISRGSEKSYAVKLTPSKFGSIRKRKPRDPFTADGSLRGYCNWAPQGTIIHPSVYLLLDEHVNISLESKELKLQRCIEDWRDRMIGAPDSPGSSAGFWLDGEDDDSSDPGAIRVLVCGNTGTYALTQIGMLESLNMSRRWKVDTDQQDLWSRCGKS
jgi:hypothetical protein